MAGSVHTYVLSWNSTLDPSGLSHRTVSEEMKCMNNNRALSAHKKMSLSHPLNYLNHCLLFVLLLVIIFPVYAGTYTLLSPQNFERQTGSAVAETVFFSAIDTTSVYTVNVYNGGLEDYTVTGEKHALYDRRRQPAGGQHLGSHAAW